MLGSEEFMVHAFHKLDWELTCNERLVDSKAGKVIGKRKVSALLKSFLKRCPVSLNAVYTESQGILQVEILRVLFQHRMKLTLEGHVVADEDTIAGDESESH